LFLAHRTAIAVVDTTPYQPRRSIGSAYSEEVRSEILYDSAYPLPYQLPPYTIRPPPYEIPPGVSASVFLSRHKFRKLQKKLMILYFNVVVSSKIWETSDTKVWLGNLATQNLPDKSQIFQLLEKQGKYLCVNLLVLWQRSHSVFERFSLNFYIRGIFYWRTLNNRALTGG